MRPPILHRSHNGARDNCAALMCDHAAVLYGALCAIRSADSFTLPPCASQCAEPCTRSDLHASVEHFVIFGTEGILYKLSLGFVLG